MVVLINFFFFIRLKSKNDKSDCVDLRLTEEFNNKFYREWNGMEPTMQELKNTKLTGPLKLEKYVESKAFDNFDWGWFDEGTNHRFYHYDPF